MFPSPKPGAKFAVAIPFMVLGCGLIGLLLLLGVNIAELEEPVLEALDRSVCAALPAMAINVSLELRVMPISSSGNVMKNRQPNVVPKKAPSTVWNLLFGGVYISRQLGQNNLTVSWPGVSL